MKTANEPEVEQPSNLQRKLKKDIEINQGKNIKKEKHELREEIQKELKKLHETKKQQVKEIMQKMKKGICYRRQEAELITEHFQKLLGSEISHTIQEYPLTKIGIPLSADGIKKWQRHMKIVKKLGQMRYMQNSSNMHQKNYTRKLQESSMTLQKQGKIYWNQ